MKSTKSQHSVSIRCRSCRHAVAPLRAGQCWPCYFGAGEKLALDEACIACGLGDRRVLRTTMLTDGEQTTCANCAAIAGERPMALDELLREVRPAAGDRRGSRGRRSEERRCGDRRARSGWIHALIGNRRAVDRRSNGSGA